jgi:hypothetical protein
MRSHQKRRTLHWALAAALVTVAAGCGDDDDSSASDPSESAYCDKAREWAIHELEPVDDTDPAAFKVYWTEFLAFEQAATDLAPDQLKTKWKLKADAERAMFTPVLEKYDYDITAIMESGTPEEQATLEAPPDVEVAQVTILTYESEVCGAVQPQPADVSFEGEVAGSYCELMAAEDEKSGAVLAEGAEPDAVKEIFQTFEQSEAALVEAAPEVIRDDVAAVSKWTNSRQKAAIERNGWDIKKVLREGSAQDRADLNFADPDIREQYARVGAYEEQVCGA